MRFVGLVKGSGEKSWTVMIQTTLRPAHVSFGDEH
jgi:hypothetical protein